MAVLMMPGARDPRLDRGVWNPFEDRGDHWLILFRSYVGFVIVLCRSIGVYDEGEARVLFTCALEECIK
jgi:hypothetical protein